MNATTFLENKIIDHFLSGKNVETSNSYLALFKNNPGENNTGTEIRGANYSRVLIKWGEREKTDLGTRVSIDYDLEFPIATGEWGDILYWGIFDKEEDGNLLIYGKLVNPVKISEGQRFIASEQLLEVIIS